VRAVRRFLDAAIMAQLCDLAKVKDAEFFSHCIHDLVERNWRVHQAHEALQAEDLIASTKRIAQAARALDEALREASKEAREAVRINLSRWPKSLDEIHTDIAKIATAAGQVRRSKPWGTVKRLFVEQLISDVKRAGGKLTFSEAGSLMRMLECLKPYLPSNFPLSFATVRRVLRGGQKVRK
jgi:hypothetical protein